MELAHSLSGQSLQMCLENFINRRGKPKAVRSDNGTNLVWVANNYKDRYGRPLNWKFIPPAAPAQGGAWERLVRSIKRALSQMELPGSLTDEELQNFLIRAESLVNARPLTEIPTHPSQPALTPNHFLFGSSNGDQDGSDDENEDEIDDCQRVYDQLLEEREEHRQLLQMFWDRWSKEYLPLIAARKKWKWRTEPLAVGDLVFIVEPSGWVRGVIKETAIDPETNQVREAMVQTANKVYRRPATKIAKICTPGSENQGSIRTSGKRPAAAAAAAADTSRTGPVTRAMARRNGDQD